MLNKTEHSMEDLLDDSDFCDKLSAATNAFFGTDFAFREVEPLAFDDEHILLSMRDEEYVDGNAGNPGAWFYAVLTVTANSQAITVEQCETVPTDILQDQLIPWALSHKLSE
jgi:hypothetical protein